MFVNSTLFFSVTHSHEIQSAGWIISASIMGTNCQWWWRALWKRTPAWKQLRRGVFRTPAVHSFSDSLPLLPWPLCECVFTSSKTSITTFWVSVSQHLIWLSWTKGAKCKLERSEAECRNAAFLFCTTETKRLITPIRFKTMVTNAADVPVLLNEFLRFISSWALLVSAFFCLLGVTTAD